jgi:hypothetical protein
MEEHNVRKEAFKVTQCNVRLTEVGDDTFNKICKM